MFIILNKFLLNRIKLFFIFEIGRWTVQYCYIYMGGKLVQQNDELWEYIGGRSKGIHVYKEMSFAEFTSRKFVISQIIP